MQLTRAPFARWEQVGDEVVFISPDFKLVTDTSILVLLPTSQTKWVPSSDELNMLQRYGILTDYISEISQYLFNLERYFESEEIELIIEQKGSTVPEAALNAYGYRVTSPKSSCIGFGVDSIKEIALLKAIAEFYERYSCDVCRNKVDTPVEAADKLTTELIKFADWQYDLEDFPYSRNASQKWIKLHSIANHNIAYAPLEYVCYPDGLLWEKMCDASSNGVAAHTNFEEALIRSVYELIERDAFMLHWFNQIPATIIEHPVALQERISHLEALGFRIYFLRLNCLVATTIMVILTRKGEKYPRLLLGLATSGDPAIAAAKALEEVELNVTYLNADIVFPNSASKITGIMDHQFWYDLPNNHFEVEKLIGKNRIEIVDIPRVENNIGLILGALHSNGLDWYYAELNTPARHTTGLYVIRSIVPGIVPINFGYQMEPLGMERIQNPPSEYGSSFNQSRLTRDGYRVQPFS